MSHPAGTFCRRQTLRTQRTALTELTKPTQPTELPGGDLAPLHDEVRQHEPGQQVAGQQQGVEAELAGRDVEALGDVLGEVEAVDVRDEVEDAADEEAE